MRIFQWFTDFRRIHSLAISEYASLPRRTRKWDHMYFRDKWILSVICSILMALKSEFWKKIDFSELSKLATNRLKIVYVCSLSSCLDDLGWFWEKCGISQHWRTKLIEDNDWYFDDPRRVLFSGSVLFCRNRFSAIFEYAYSCLRTHEINNQHVLMRFMGLKCYL